MSDPDILSVAREALDHHHHGKPCMVCRLAQAVIDLSAALASAGLSLDMYEYSEGCGNGIEESFEIARLLGYEGDLTRDPSYDGDPKRKAVTSWLAQIAVPLDK